ncbi:MAG TPA: MFS transporter [Candidatus Binatia bacterium]|nr:MFS transporter [Candidatus Binatia bacterium]
MSDDSGSQAETNEVVLRPWSSLLIRDFSLIWTSSVLAATSAQIRNVCILYQVYQLSGSSFQLGLTGFLQALPHVIFGLFAGVLADAFDRKKVILCTHFLHLVPSLLLGFLTVTGTIQVWHIYLFGTLASFIEVFGWPARAAIVPSLVPPSHLMNAITLTSMILQSSFLVGPAIAGVLIDHTGVAQAYFISAGFFAPAIVAVLAMHASGKPQGERRRVSVRSMVEGLEFIWIQRIILSLFLLDFGVTLVGFYRPILPIFASDVFKMGGTGLGALYSAPAIGSLLGSTSVLLVGDVRRKGALAVVAALFFAGGLMLLGLSKWFWMAAASVVLLGYMDSLSVAVRRTVVQFLAPDAMRGRAASLITVFAQCTNALGALLAGIAAQLWGAPNALVIGGFVCVVMIFGITRAIPQLWHYRSDEG